MNMSQLAAEVSKKVFISDDLSEAQSEALIYDILRESFLTMKLEVMSGEKVVISNFGTFSLVLRKPRKQHDVTLGKVVMRKPSRRVVFKPSKAAFKRRK